MVEIEIFDEVNFQIRGLSKRELDAVQKQLKFPVKGAFMQYAFQLGEWDGKESLLDDEGYGFIYHLDVVGSTLEDLGFEEDEVKIIDSRETVIDLPTDPIDENYLLEELGYPLRDYQVDLLNMVITQQKGIIDAATNAGKASIAVGIAKYYQDYIQTLTIVPNEKLLNQICKDFEKAGFDYVKLNSKVPVKKRPEMIRNHRNIVITSKLLVNVLDYEDETGDTAIIGKPFAFINDETHTFGDTMYYAMRAQLFASPIRIGLTGTVPKDKLKREKLVACLGGDELDKVSAKFLMDNGYAAKTNITMYQTFHPEVQELSTHEEVRAGRWEWDKDESYYSNHERLEAIAEFIKTFDDGTNTLILCHAATGNKLKEMLGLEFIDKDTPIHERDRMFEAFDEEDNVTVLASYGTSSTGISQNNIFRGFLIDIGKDETTIKQSIGRFMRLDGVINKVELFDIYADSYYAKKHAKERIKIYKREGHEFLESKEFVMV